MAMRCSVFASLLMVVGIVMLANLSGISAQIACGVDLRSLAYSCGRYIAKGGPEIPPSQDCCGAFKAVDVPCFCQNIVPHEDQISPEKTIYVARTCGLSVPAGFKCGSYTVPPVSSTIPEE